MKDYEHIVIWLDYFNKNLKRSEGRKLELGKCVYDPSLKELVNATTAAGFEVTESNETARYPKRPFVRSGYIILKKETPKTKILYKISEKMLARKAK